MTEKQKHTPGPWKADPPRPGQELYWSIRTIREYKVLDRPEKSTIPIALSSHGWFKYDGANGKAETKANAELIASAPQLKAERDEAVRLLDDLVYHFRSYDNFDNFRNHVHSNTNPDDRIRVFLDSIG